MSDYVDGLERALRDAAAREYGGSPANGSIGSAARSRPDAQQGAPAKRSRRWQRRWSPLAVAAVALLLGGSTAAAIVVLGTERSAPLTGVVPDIPAALLHYNIPFTPDLEAGHAGWCSSPRLSLPGVLPESGAGTCSPAITQGPGAPVLIAGGEPISNARQLFAAAHRRLASDAGQINLVWMVVSAKVAAVRLRRGLVIAPRSDPRLPKGLRGLAAFITGTWNPVPLDRSGRVIPLHPRRTKVASLTHRNPGGDPAEVSPVRHYDPNGTTSAPCAIHRASMPVVTAQWEVVATTTPRLGRSVAANVLFSCATTWFSLRGRSHAPIAALLLNARNPRRPAPPLPGLQRTPEPGVFREDGGASGEILARRVGRAWLVVEAQSESISHLLLTHLHVAGSTIGR